MPHVIHPIARAEMYAQFPNPIADGLRVSGMASGEAYQPIIDSNPGGSIAEAGKPIVEGLGLKEDDLSCI